MADKNPNGGNHNARVLKAKVSYIGLNKGTMNEHLVVFHQFAKPGTYSYNTSHPNSVRLPPVSLQDQGMLNRGVTLMTDMLFNHPYKATTPDAGSRRDRVSSAEIK